MQRYGLISCVAIKQNKTRSGHSWVLGSDPPSPRSAKSTGTSNFHVLFCYTIQSREGSAEMGLEERW